MKRNNTKPIKDVKTLEEGIYMPPSPSVDFCFSYPSWHAIGSMSVGGLEDGYSLTTRSVVCLVFTPHSVRVPFGFVSDPRRRYWFVNAGDDIAWVLICNLFWVADRIRRRARTAPYHLYTI